MKALITAGPTYEPIDSVRFIGNYSSGKQGIEIAKAFSEAGFDVDLVLGKVCEHLVSGLSEKVKIKKVRTADEMLKICLSLLPYDIAIFSAAVSDYRPKNKFDFKVKKDSENPLKNIELVENPDILKTISNHINRPKVIIGFSAETNNVVENAMKKLCTKNCDFIVANEVCGGKVFGKEENKIILIEKNGKIRKYPKMTKREVGDVLLGVVSDFLIL